MASEALNGVLSFPIWGSPRALGALAASALLLAAPALAQPVTVAGELVLSETFAIAENSSVQLRLVDLDAYDAGAVDGDELSIGPETAQPIAFSFGVFADRCRPVGTTRWRRGSIRGPRRRAVG